jgi:hypothetical protein
MEKMIIIIQLNFYSLACRINKLIIIIIIIIILILIIERIIVTTTSTTTAETRTPIFLCLFLANQYNFFLLLNILTNVSVLQRV